MRARSLLRLPLILVPWMAIACAVTACTSTAERAREAERFWLPQIEADRLWFRRPDRPLYDEDEAALNPHRLPEVDDRQYATHDCERPGEVIGRTLPLEGLHACLVSLSARQTVRYRLEWDGKNPVFRLRDPEDAPACLAQTLRELPVPREAVYQDADGCFAQRLDPKRKVELRVVLPVETLEKSPESTRRVLLGWALAAFYDARRRAYPAFYLPQRFCDRCKKVGPTF